MTDDEIIVLYMINGTLKDTAIAAGVSTHVIRRVLVEHGLLTNDTHFAVANLAEEGLSPDEIASALKKSITAVYDYLPYTKGRYMADNPTDNALKIRKTRAKARATDKPIPHLCRDCGAEIELTGKRGGPPQLCPDCKRKRAEKKIKKCIVCGAEFSIAGKRGKPPMKCAKCRKTPEAEQRQHEVSGERNQTITGYQQAILYLNGSQMGDWFCVRNIDKHYVDAVQEIFLPYAPYLQSRAEEGKKDYWAIKSHRVRMPLLEEIADPRGFCRGFVELQGVVDKRLVEVRGKAYWRTRLRVYGAEGDLEFVMDHLPAKPKKIQHIKTHTGQTCQLSYASASEIADILDWLNGSPRNENVWEKWLALVPIKSQNKETNKNDLQ